MGQSESEERGNWKPKNSEIEVPGSLTRPILVTLEGRNKVICDTMVFLC